MSVTLGLSSPAGPTTRPVNCNQCDEQQRHTLSVLRELCVVDDVSTRYLVRTCEMRSKCRKVD